MPKHTPAERRKNKRKKARRKKKIGAAKDKK